MSHKKLFLLLAVLATTVLGYSQTRLTDDRELFIGVSGNSLIAPNVMILMDNSGSMETAIYHPAYDMNTNYRVDAENRTLTINNLDDFFTESRFGENYRTLKDPITFNICRGTPHYVIGYDVRGVYASQIKKNPRIWKVFRDSGVFVDEGIVDYDGAGSGVNDHTRIKDISSLKWDSTARRYYWEITVDTTYPGFATNGNPDTGSYIYMNYRQEVDYTDSTIAQLTVAGDSCTGYDVQLLNTKLYGTTDTNLTEGVMYDLNYLYWLCFHATSQQVAEVTNWTNTGNYINPVTNVVEYAGYYRLAVTKDVLATVAEEVYETVRLGLARFQYFAETANNGGGMVMDVMQNNGNLNEFLIKIRNINTQNLGTPLAETMADIWYYFKGGLGNDYWPNGMNGAGTNCGGGAVTEEEIGEGGSFPASCPIQYWCQKSYVIVMTDGQSTADDFNHTKYLDSYFVQEPVATWGDDDGHDPSPVPGTQPVNLTKPDGTPYCPNNTCWIPASSGTDLLDDMAYFMRNNDLFPDDLYPAMPDKQAIETFVIGFNADNDMLAETARNGNGEYYTARSYTTLKNALKNAITNILLRNFAFAAFTAPKKITTTTGEGYSFIGYFLPSGTEPIWDGHLQSYKLTDKWCVDANNNTELDGEECATSYYYEQNCLDANPGKVCLRSIELASVPEWDTAEEILNVSPTTGRSLFTHDSRILASPYALINFTDPANIATLQELFGLPTVEPDPLLPTYLPQAQTIVNTIKGRILGDIFHSDIIYVGPPLAAKKYLKNLNPSDCGSADRPSDPDCFESLAAAQASRTKVLYVGTNDGVVHQVDAVSGAERWGFIPDEVLPSLKNIVIDRNYTFTTDGRMTAEDIYYRGTGNSWKTILPFGLKDGGKSIYTLDVTTVGNQPSLLWKFVDADYSGKSWSKPYVGKIRFWDGSQTIDRWVVIVTGGMAFNNGNSNDTAGKAIFVIDASSGELIWMIGYNGSGQADNAATSYIDTLVDDGYAGPGERYLTAKTEFNYPIPAAITPVDRDNDGFLDTIYYGNVAGHLFKTDISSSAPANWKSYLLFKKDISTYQAQTTVSSVSGTVLNVASTKDFAVNQNIFGLTSKAMGIIEAVGNKSLTVTTISPAAAFTAETIVVPTFDPIFLSPAVFFDSCFNLWVGFGTGDRIRSRTNPDSGKFAAFRDGTTVVSSATVQKTDITLSDLVPLTWSDDTLNATNIKVTGKWGWYFIFPDAANHEKLFDPEPLVLPDLNMVPHIYFNTYQPASESLAVECNAPKEGSMIFYDLALDYCSNGSISGDRESGRIAGGGMFQGTDFILYEGTGNVASIPPLQEIKPIKLIYTGGLLFYKEKKR